uniref:Uncharacterized protein n=1 Tax=Candidatus Kentrum sp. FW TaxID=2126338 RepID=A0A450TUF4_9GAMM|nr:MAG: hypothetical protein BECKFW1821C_GA0114237_103413 [Candidatus Kentron sp. FW]
MLVHLLWLPAQFGSNQVGYWGVSTKNFDYASWWAGTSEKFRSYGQMGISSIFDVIGDMENRLYI